MSPELERLQALASGYVDALAQAEDHDSRAYLTASRDFHAAVSPETVLRLLRVCTAAKKYAPQPPDIDMVEERDELHKALKEAGV